MDTKTQVTNYKNIKFKDNSRGKVSLIRNMKDDTFTIEIENDIESTNSSQEITPYVNINNDIVIDGQSPMAVTGHIFGNKVIYRAYSGMMKDIKFREIKQLYIGLMQGDNIMQMYMLKITLPSINKYMDVNPGEVGEITAIKKLTFQTHEPITTSSDAIGTKPVALEIIPEYTTLFYVPEKRDRNEAITDLAKIYISGSGNDDPKSYIEDDITKVKTTALSKGIETFVDKSETEPNFNLQDNFNTGEAKYVGEVKITDSTYYDYDKAKTMLGYSSEAVVGEIVPYSFKGSYSWIQELHLFDFLGKFIFRTATEYDHSILDSFDGDVILDVDNDFEEEVAKLKTLDADDLDAIKDADDISLRGLLRISNEKIS